MNVLFWNVRGLNKLAKQNDVVQYLRYRNIDVCGLLKTKVKHFKADDVLRCSFGNWFSLNNYTKDPTGCIWCLWNPNKVQVHYLDCSD